MEAYDKLISLVENDSVKQGAELPKIYLHKWLVLGQTEHVCRHGTLSDGHEKLTDSQRYAQALKEWYSLALNIRSQKTIAKRAQADLIDAEEKLTEAVKDSAILRAEADKEDAETRLLTALVTVEDQMRMVRVYESEVKKLKSAVEKQYPKGIEQAEVDNWNTVANYRMLKNPGGERLDNVPLSPVDKAKIGLKYKRTDALAPLMVIDAPAFIQLEKKQIGNANGQATP